MSALTDFLDVRAHGFVRVAVCVPEVRVADPTFNAEAHLRILTRAHTAGAHYALCPELGLSAYSCGDLFFQETLLDAALQALERIARATAGWNLLVSVGMPLVADGLLFNTAVTLYGGRPLAVAAKAYPPNYREFYELRWFRPAAEARSDTIDLLGTRVPFGTDGLGRPAHLSASNVTVAKSDYRDELVRSSSAKNLAVQMYSAAGFGESTADLAWDGQGIIAERGEILAETTRFGLTGTLALADVDPRVLVEDRMRQTSFGQNAARHVTAFRVVAVEGQAERRGAEVFHR